MASNSRPPSAALLVCTHRPTLQDILSNTAPPPWTLAAFMAYLSSNHCLETLEFTLDTKHYRAAYEHGADHLPTLWQKLMQAYILPSSHREVNLPARVRDRLLSLDPAVQAPSPAELDEAVQIVYELMNDSVLLPFLNEMSSAMSEHDCEHCHDVKLAQGRSKTPRDVAIPEDASRSATSSFLPQLHLGRRNDGAARSNSSLADIGDRETLTDDSGNSSPPAGEPLTPPTTPPTSDWGFGSSPGTLQRAISAHNNGWKRMSARLGLSRRTRQNRKLNVSSAPYASSPDDDVDMTLCEGTSSDIDTSTMSAQYEHLYDARPASPSRLTTTEPLPGGGRRDSTLPATTWVQETGISEEIRSSVDYGGDMAAKGYARDTIYRPVSRPWLARKYARPKLRNNALPRLMVAGSWFDDEDSKQISPALERCTVFQRSPLSATPIRRSSTSECPNYVPEADPMEADTDTSSSSSESSADDATIRVHTPSLSSASGLSLTDFSNFLGSGRAMEVDDGSVTVFECDSHSSSNSGDCYGWEAELDRKISVGGHPSCRCGHLHYRRADGARRSLLNRVFNIVNAPKQESTLARRLSETNIGLPREGHRF